MVFGEGMKGSLRRLVREYILDVPYTSFMNSVYSLITG